MLCVLIFLRITETPAIVWINVFPLPKKQQKLPERLPPQLPPAEWACGSSSDVHPSISAPDLMALTSIAPSPVRQKHCTGVQCTKVWDPCVNFVCSSANNFLQLNLGKPIAPFWGGVGWFWCIVWVFAPRKHMGLGLKSSHCHSMCCPLQWVLWKAPCIRTSPAASSAAQLRPRAGRHRRWYEAVTCYEGRTWPRTCRVSTDTRRFLLL